MNSWIKHKGWTIRQTSHSYWSITSPTGFTITGFLSEEAARKEVNKRT